VPPFLSWLIMGAVGPAAFGLPVTWAATDLAGAAQRWFRRLRRSDGLSRIVRAAAGDLDLSRAEFVAVRRLLGEEATWVQVGRDNVEDLAALIASRLSVQPSEGSLAAGRAIVAGLLEFAVRDLEPEWFQQVLFARLDRLQADQASALDQVMLSVHADLVALLAAQNTAAAERFAGVMSELGRVLDRLPPGPADPGQVAVYLAMLIRWLNLDPWPQDTRFAGPTLTPSAIEQKLTITEGLGQGERELDADDLARQCARLVVLAGPGSGKTWLAKRTARLCAETALDKLAAGSTLDEVELPLYTTCARLSAAPPSDGIRRALVGSALGQLPDFGGARVVDALQMLFENRDAPTLVVADSLDEARGADGRIRQADTLLPSWRIVLTSRRGSWNRQLAMRDDDRSRRVGFLQPVRYPDDVEQVIAGWFSGRPDWAARLTLQLRNRPVLQQAATVPLILAFFCIVGGDQPLPGRRTDLYTKVIRRMLLGRWRDSGNREPDPDVDACLDILRDWAWCAAASDLVSGVGIWEDEFLTPRVRRSQDDRDALDHVATPLGPPDPDTGMTRRRFVHRSIREHLVAEHIALRMPASQAAEEIVHHLWYDPDWEYAAPAALAMHPRRDQVLQDLTRRARGGGQPGGGLAAIDGCWEIRRFLARVAQESCEGDWLPVASRLIGQARLELSTSQQYDLHEVVTGDWPTSNGQVIQSLLDLFPGEPDSLPEPFPVQADSLFELLPEEADHTRALRLAEAVTQLAVAVDERARAREVLLGLLASQTDPGKAVGPADAIPRLDPTPEEQAQAREAMLGLLVGHADPGTTFVLAEAVAQLEPTAQERVRAQQPLLALLADDPDSTPILVETIERLAATAAQRARAQETLFGLLASETGAWYAQKQADALVRLARTAQERAKGRERLVTLLGGEADPGKAGVLAEAVARLDPTAEERAQSRQHLVTLLRTQAELPNQATFWTADRLADAVARFAVTAEERAEVRGPLLALLASETDPWSARILAAASARLDPTPQERARVRQPLLALLRDETNLARAYVLGGTITRLAVNAGERAGALEIVLTLLASETDPDRACHLAEAVAGLDPTPEERARARQPLLALLASRTEPWMARGLVDTVARLSPTVADLDGSDGWPSPPTSALLAAARQNSKLSTWLAALPTLSESP
jgi:hypothetical protein